jgi:hypothetical protein
MSQTPEAWQCSLRISSSVQHWAGLIRTNDTCTVSMLLMLTLGKVEWRRCRPLFLLDPTIAFVSIRSPVGHLRTGFFTG